MKKGFETLENEIEKAMKMKWIRVRYQNGFSLIRRIGKKELRMFFKFEPKGMLRFIDNAIMYDFHPSTSALINKGINRRVCCALPVIFKAQDMLDMSGLTHRLIDQKPWKENSVKHYSGRKTLKERKQLVRELYMRGNSVKSN